MNILLFYAGRLLTCMAVLFGLGLVGSAARLYYYYQHPEKDKNSDGFSSSLIFVIIFGIALVLIAIGWAVLWR